MQKYSQEQGTVVGGHGKELYNGQMGDKKFGDEGGKSAALAEGGRISQWRYTCRRSPRRGESQCYSRGAAPRVRAAKSSEVR